LSILFFATQPINGPLLCRVPSVRVRWWSFYDFSDPPESNSSFPLFHLRFSHVPFFLVSRTSTSFILTKPPPHRDFFYVLLPPLFVLAPRKTTCTEYFFEAVPGNLRSPFTHTPPPPTYKSQPSLFFKVFHFRVNVSEFPNHRLDESRRQFMAP